MSLKYRQRASHAVIDDAPTLKMFTLSFNDLQGKLRLVRDGIARLYGFMANTPDCHHATAEAQKTCINTHARFYGLRSKYDGRGNRREPLKG